MDNPKSAPARKYTLKTAHPSPQTTYVVKSSAARMPASCWGTYRRVAVLEVVRGTTPRMISTRATGVVRVRTQPGVKMSHLDNYNYHRDSRTWDVPSAYTVTESGPDSTKVELCESLLETLVGRWGW